MCARKLVTSLAYAKDGLSMSFYAAGKATGEGAGGCSTLSPAEGAKGMISPGPGEGDRSGADRSV